MDNLESSEEINNGMFDENDDDDIDIDDTIFEKPQQTTFTEEEYNKMAKMMMEMNMKVQTNPAKQPKGNVGKIREATNLVENMKKFNRQRFGNTTQSSSQQEKLAKEDVEKEVVEEVIIDSMCELEFTE